MPKQKKFLRRGAGLKKLDFNWRKPRGIHNKLRKRKRGKWNVPSIGYGNANILKHLVGGLMPVLVRNVNELKKLTKDNLVVISGNVGMKKKIQMLEEIKKLKLKVKNIDDIDKFLKEVEENFKKRKEVKETKDKEKQKSKEEFEKKAKVKEGEKKKESEDENKEEDEKKESAKKVEPKIKEMKPAKEMKAVKKTTAPKSQ